MDIKRLQKQFPGLETETQAQRLAAELRRERGGIALSLGGVPLMVAAFFCVGVLRWGLLAAGLALFALGSVLLNRGRMQRTEQWDALRYRIKDGKKVLELWYFRKLCRKRSLVRCGGWTALMAPGIAVSFRDDMPREMPGIIALIWLAGILVIAVSLWVAQKRLPRTASAERRTVVRKSVEEGRNGRVFWLYFDSDRKKSVSEAECKRCTEGETEYLLLFVGKRFSDALPADEWVYEKEES